MEIGDRIRDWRKRRGLTQEELAKAIGVDKSAVGQWETTSSARKGIQTSNLVKAAAVLRCKVSDLTGDAADDTGIHINDPDEIGLIAAFRRLPANLKGVHLQLIYVSAGLSDGAEEKGNPTKGKRIAS